MEKSRSAVFVGACLSLLFAGCLFVMLSASGAVSCSSSGNPTASVDGGSGGQLEGGDGGDGGGGGDGEGGGGGDDGGGDADADAWPPCTELGTDTKPTCVAYLIGDCSNGEFGPGATYSGDILVAPLGGEDKVACIVAEAAGDYRTEIEATFCVSAELIVDVAEACGIDLGGEDEDDGCDAYGEEECPGDNVDTRELGDIAHCQWTGDKDDEEVPFWCQERDHCASERAAGDDCSQFTGDEDECNGHYMIDENGPHKCETYTQDNPGIPCHTRLDETCVIEE